MTSGGKEPCDAPHKSKADEPQQQQHVAPTISSPFNFPTDTELPSYLTAVSSESKQSGPVIAIPQLKAEASSPFINVYPPLLLSHGITKDTWRSFLDTISAFLTAKVSDRAISHAGDMAKHLYKSPKRITKGLATHVKDVGKGIATSAKQGNILGAAFGAVGGAVSIPVVTAFGIIGAAAELPGSAVGAIVKKPRTPGQRAAAYAEVANKKWLNARGLEARMFDTNELAQFLGVPVLDLINAAQGTNMKGENASDQLAALERWVAPLEVVAESPRLALETHTIWLVLVTWTTGGVEGTGDE
ncbi:uncharacterized protein F5Z01DRAFT_681072 [Emericellopsis atlantica]|uniref:Uncharacterized protein n=1 Tax=Emericellopsis atlantica TaxID=2614577 RepID=A0A9P8CRS0_9HYPO|nr:uncharacterized protein F5Z01DRAFT_681072 [Emericellopsis atlantica]KAG9255016.1 hypothetical protein F5Z01DRAFT_681072 [Emericellopsis atlantica]